MMPDLTLAVFPAVCREFVLLLWEIETATAITYPTAEAKRYGTALGEGSIRSLPLTANTCPSTAVPSSATNAVFFPLIALTRLTAGSPFARRYHEQARYTAHMVMLYKRLCRDVIGSVEAMLMAIAVAARLVQRLVGGLMSTNCIGIARLYSALEAAFE